jgi:hypothetical protein
LLWGEPGWVRLGWVLIFPDRLFLVSLDFAAGAEALEFEGAGEGVEHGEAEIVEGQPQIQKRVVSSSLVLCGRTRTRMLAWPATVRLVGGVGVRGDDLDMLTGQSGFHLVERNGGAELDGE